MVSGDRVTPSFAALEDDTGVEVLDPIERRRYALSTPDRVRPEPVDDDPFRVTVDSVARVTTTEIRLGDVVDVFVHETTEGVTREVRPGTEHDLPAGEYQVELNAPVKLYLGVSGPLAVDAGVSETRLSFDGRREVLLGARSYHERPAATVTTSPRPADAMTAVSALGSALKTTSCERSYPTLRGHPPAIEGGSSLAVPDGIERPDTGVTLELPPAVESALVAAPLAYYLGAEVVPAGRPRLVTDDGFVHPLETPDTAFEDAVARTLQQVFFLDCLTRTEGLYPMALHEREQVEARVDLDFERLYGQSLSRQLERYLAVPFDVVEPGIPTWPLAAHLSPEPEQLEAVPYVVNELALVRTAAPRELSDGEIRRRSLADYAESGCPNAGAEYRDAGTRPGGAVPDSRVVEVGSTGAADDAWFGPDVPFTATKGVPAAYRNRFDREPSEMPIDIAVVCNDPGMANESDAVAEVYGSRESLPFAVSLHDSVETGALRDLLASDVDFLHYVGHVSAEGLHCPNGVLDVGTLDEAGVGAFFLNACASYEQAVRLVEAGAVGGVATVDRVTDSGAAVVGRTMARLLNLGFPLRGALRLARAESVVGGHYVVVGDGNTAVAVAEGGVPIVCDVTETGPETYEVGVRTFVPEAAGIGSTVYPTVEDDDRHYLVPGTTATYELSGDDLREYLAWHPYPVRTDGELRWNDLPDPPDR